MMGRLTRVEKIKNANDLPGSLGTPPKPHVTISLLESAVFKYFCCKTPCICSAVLQRSAAKPMKLIDKMNIERVVVKRSRSRLAVSYGGFVRNINYCSGKNDNAQGTDTSVILSGIAAPRFVYFSM
jgi:hypothetical protein